MQVLRYLEPHRVEVAEMPRPVIQAGEVLVRLRACGVCATDVKTFTRGHPFIHAGSVLGHEMTGVIAETQIEGWSVGERVVVAPYVPCGNCSNCARGQFTLCQDLYGASVEPGGFSEYLRVPNRIVRKGLFRLPPEIEFTLGALVEPIACCLFGLEALELKRDESFLIVGDGPMGMLQAILARALGAAPVVMAGMTPARLALGARFADHVINVAEVQLPEAIKELTHGTGMDKVIVSVGQAQVAEEALALVRRGGMINFFAGLPSHSRVSIDPNRIHYDRITVVGTSGFAPSHFEHGLDLLASHAAEFRACITQTVPLSGLEQAFLDSVRYEGIKTVAVME
jgi:L-iditol 2-dehydrogenase